MEYRDLLKEFQVYDNTVINIEKLYINSNDLNLAKEKYNLVKIAGSNTQFSQIINILNWIHNEIRHVADVNLALQEMNIDGILNKCKIRGGSCLILSTALMEALLSLGFKSRYIRCMPFDYMDGDCHVVVEVYCNDLNKWIMIDPTFECYITDSENVILSLNELRYKLAMREDLKINKQFNYNGEFYNKHEYLNYMAKNTFRFEIPMVNTYGTETIKNNVKLELSPLYYDGKDNNLKYIQCAEEYIKNQNITEKSIIEFYKERKEIVINRTIYTHNMDEFWL